jgi:signal transduction histidine kinase
MQIFARGEELEYKQQNYDAAIVAFRDLTSSSAPGIRAGAHLRIARNLRKAGRFDLALAEYQEMARCGSVPVDGVPAELVARRARLALLRQLGRTASVHEEAGAVASGLSAGYWQLTRAAFLHYAEAAGYDPPPEAQAFADAVDWLWRKRSLAPSGQEAVAFDGRELTLVWRDEHAMVAGPRYVEQHWLTPLAPLLKSQGVRLALNQPAVPGVIVRERAATGLPWAIAVSSAEPDVEARELTFKRRLLLTASGLLAAILSAAGYTIIRAVNRELAAARLQSEFVAAVSHEFRTPLTLLRQITEIFTENRVADEAQREAYYRAQGRATERLHRLVESLLDFRRMEAGAKPYRLRPLDPALLVRKVVGDFQSETASNGYGVELSIHEGVPEVNADSDALTHAVWNLLDNAVKYSPDERAIWVDVGRQGEGVAIAIRDKGLGIPAGEQKAVFRKFVRGAAARLHEIKGTGIGLAMVRNIVQAHGGKVLLESAPGVGSTFTIVLPAGKRICPGS